MKQCTKCNELRPLSDYRKDKQKKDGLHSHCKPCCKANAKRWWKTQRELPIEDRRVKYLKYEYGLSIEEFHQMWLNQDGVCAICVTPLSLEQNGYAVDHNHVTNEVRGLLCKTCNQGIGLLKDNPAILEAGANYLRKYGCYGETY